MAIHCMIITVEVNVLHRNVDDDDSDDDDFRYIEML